MQINEGTHVSLPDPVARYGLHHPTFRRRYDRHPLTCQRDELSEIVMPVLIGGLNGCGLMLGAALAANL